MIDDERIYAQRASAGQLHTTPSHPRAGNEILSIGRLSRGELKNLYTGNMARKGKPARSYYDQLRVSVAGDICPYCGIGPVETIDHFLPKGRYSSLSVMPVNLVPACRDCNTEKLDGIATSQGLTAHPYFEDQCVVNERWLWATIISTPMVHVEFRATPPIGWNIAVANRILNHFSDLDLARRYSIQAAGRLTYYATILNGLYEEHAGTSAEDSISLIMNLSTQSERNAYGLNSWQHALAAAIANDRWFIQDGYKQAS